MNLGNGRRAMNDESIHDFVLDWSMNMKSKRELCREFFYSGWDFQLFYQKVQEMRMWANSMYALLYAEDFGSY